MALQRTLLTATSYELAASFLNQPLEHVALRLRTQELVGSSVRPQTILRVGYPAQQSGETPRGPWRQTLDHWH